MLTLRFLNLKQFFRTLEILLKLEHNFSLRVFKESYDVYPNLIHF